MVHGWFAVQERTASENADLKKENYDFWASGDPRREDFVGTYGFSNQSGLLHLDRACWSLPPTPPHLPLLAYTYPHGPSQPASQLIVIGFWFA